MSKDESNLRLALKQLDPSLRNRLTCAGFDDEQFVAFAQSLLQGDAKTRRALRNRLRGVVSVPAAGDIDSFESSAPKVTMGMEAIAAGKLAFCVMAGGMATRMGGVVKALVPVTDDKTFLDIRLAENAVFSKRAGKAIPLWLMTSDATDAPLRDALKKANAPAHVSTFTQNLSLRLTAGGELFRDSKGQPSTFAPGHGDLPEALRRSGLLQKFLATGGEYVWITNVDNLGATIDPGILAAFIATKKDVMVEVCEKAHGDKGGIPVHAEGKLQIVEEFRLPENFDGAQVRVFNTNTFLVRAHALADASFPSTYFEVEKNVEGKVAIQFERLLQELTANFHAAYLRVSREGTSSRFEPVKDASELEQRRPEIRALLAARGIL